MSTLRGALVWAVAPFVPEAPFRIYAGRAQPPVTVPSARELLRAASEGGDSQHAFIAEAKLRPVLVLDDPADARRPEVAVLRLIRLETRTQDEKARIRDQQDPMLWHLPLARFPRLGKESAVDVAALLRIHVSAIAGKPVGSLDASDLRIVGERLIRHLKIDTTLMVEREVGRRLVAFRRIADRDPPASETRGG